MGKGNVIDSYRWLTIVGYIASILTIAQTIVFLSGIQEGQPIELIVVVISILLCIVALSILLVNAQIKNEKLIYSQGKVEQKLKIFELSLEATIKNAHNINHQLRQISMDFYYPLVFEEENETDREEAETEVLTEEESEGDNLIDGIDIKTMEHKFRAFLQNYTENIRDSFNVLTQDRCSVYISLIDNRGEDWFVKTFYRDPLSYRERTSIDLKTPEYNTKTFTPFKIIVDKKQNVFACDNCITYPNFSDRNDDWQNYYNACLTIPIRLRLKKKDEYIVMGFLTVDNKMGGLTTKTAVELLCSYSDSLYLPLCMFMDLKNFISEENYE